MTNWEAPVTKLTDAETYVLRFTETYGPSVNFGDRTSKATTRNAAKHLIEIGFLSGDHKNCGITPAGRAALAEGGAK